MNKKGFAEGLSWFFAIIVTLLILILFYAVSSLFFMSVKSNIEDTYLGDFYKLDSLRQIRLMEDYDHQGIYNNLSYWVFNENDFSARVDLTEFLSAISMNIFSSVGGQILPAYVMFSFRSSYQTWSYTGMVLKGQGKHLAVSSESSEDPGVLYPERWDMVTTKGDISYHVNRLYRIYFANKYNGFVRFGTSAMTRQYEK